MIFELERHQNIIVPSYLTVNVDRNTRNNEGKSQKNENDHAVFPSICYYHLMLQIAISKATQLRVIKKPCQYLSLKETQIKTKTGMAVSVN